jgi:L-asparaginase
MSIYEVGRLAMDAGIISMSNITTEALVTKLMWLLSQDLSVEEVRDALATNYAGELVVI